MQYWLTLRLDVEKVGNTSAIGIDIGKVIENVHTIPYHTIHVDHYLQSQIDLVSGLVAVVNESIPHLWNLGLIACMAEKTNKKYDILIDSYGLYVLVSEN